MSSQLAASPVIDVICAGSAFEMGIAQGRGVRDKIQIAEVLLRDLEAFRLQQPKWLPYSVYTWAAQRKAFQFLSPPVQQDHPEMAERLRGIAAGSGLGLKSLYLFNALEAMLSLVGGCTACPGACSAVAVRKTRSETGETILARNFDYLPLIQPCYFMRESRPEGKLRAVEFTTAPLAGTVDGINEAGLCITYNYGYTMDTPPKPGCPLSMAISGALANCHTVQEAADWIRSKPRWGGGLLMLCDAEGEMASLEMSSTRSHLRRPAAGEDILFHTNAFSGESMREIQIPDEAIYTETAPKPLRGRRLHESSSQRDQRLVELLDSQSSFDADQLAEVMSDHGPTNEPSANTLCVHSDYWHTTASLQFFPQARKVRVSFSSACQGRLPRSHALIQPNREEASCRKNGTLGT